MDVLHQDDVLVLAEGNLVVLVVHGDGHAGSINVPDGHLVVSLLRLERGHCVGYLELSVDCSDVGVGSSEGVLEVNRYLDDVSGLAERSLIVVRLVSHFGVIDGRLNYCAVNDLSVLGQLEVGLVALDIDRLDGQLVALFELEWVGRGDGLLGVVID